MPLINPKDRIYKKPYKPSYMTSLAREMRKNPTESELLLWLAMREKGFFGCHFRRQAPFGRHIFDFYCVKRKFAIEVDGGSHNHKEKYDQTRDREVAVFGINVMRVKDSEVAENIGKVLKRIEEALSG